MREFFKGWRRTAGCVTLVMALAFLGGWVRSFHVVDTFRIVCTENDFGSNFQQIFSIDGRMEWIGSGLGTPQFADWAVQEFHGSPFGDDGVKWHFQLAGVKSGTLEDEP